MTTGALLNSSFSYNHALFFSTCTLLAWELGPLHCLLLMFQADIPQFLSLNLVLLEIKLRQPGISFNMELKKIKGKSSQSSQTRTHFSRKLKLVLLATDGHGEQYTLNVWSRGKSFVFPGALMFPKTKSRETSGLSKKLN